MTDRIDRALDGDLTESQLSVAERARLARSKAVIDEVGDALRSVPAPDLTDGVMESLAVGEVRPRRSRLVETVEWLWQPRQVTWRPAYGFAAVILLLLPVGIGMLTGGADADPVPVAAGTAPRPTEQPAQVYVQFRFEAPDAAEVALAGSFTEWSPEIRLVETMPGVWSVLVPLDPGVHDYTFVIDGEQWVPDPAAPQVDDGFGGTNSRLFLTTPPENA